MDEKSQIILEAMTRLLKGSIVAYDDPNVNDIKKIDRCEWDEEYNEVKIYMDDGTWAHSDWVCIIGSLPQG